MSRARLDPDALSGGIFAPALRYHHGRDYPFISEGGTEHYHAVTVARSRELNGPYENFRGNPILTHGNLSMYHPIGMPVNSLYEVKDGKKKYGQRPDKRQRVLHHSETGAGNGNVRRTLWLQPGDL